MNMTKTVRSFLLGAAGMALVLAANAEPARPPASGGMGVPGGWNEARKDNADVKTAASFAASQLPGAPKLKSIETASQQVVAGMNYRMEITLSDASRWEVTVYRRFNGEMSLTNSMKLSPVQETILSLNGKGFALNTPGKPARQIAFGTKRADVMKALSFRSEPGESTNSECGAGPIDFASWPDGLNLLFQDGKFGGWSLDERADSFKADKGVMIGTSRDALNKAASPKVEKSTLGTEFSYGGISGILSNGSAKGKVTSLWAGLSCVFR